MAFTSWSALKTQMLDDFASGDWSMLKSYSIGTRQVTYRSFVEFKQQLEFVEAMAARESGQSFGRVYAVSGGGR